MSTTAIAGVESSQSRRVVTGVLDALEGGLMAPGQRLVEADLCVRFAVGRNVAREALQWLEAMGVVDISRHKGARIIERSLAEALQAMELAELLTGMAARVAARAIKGGADDAEMSRAMSDVAGAIADQELQGFIRARRAFHSAMLRLGGHRDLQRIYATLNIHVLRAQYDFTTIHRAYAEDYALIGLAVVAGDEVAAEQAARDHVNHVRVALATRANGAVS